jgi:hypothetical protein
LNSSILAPLSAERLDPSSLGAGTDRDDSSGVTLEEQMRVPLRGHAYADSLLDCRFRRQGGLDTETRVQLFDGTEHLSEHGSVLAGGEGDCPSSQGMGLEEGGLWRGEAGLVSCHLETDGKDVAAYSAAVDEADASRSHCGYMRDAESRRGWCGVANARGGGGWTHDLKLSSSRERLSKTPEFGLSTGHNRRRRRGGARCRRPGLFRAK